jgi:transcriptional regulator with XRE-family HTH domain
MKKIPAEALLLMEVRTPADIINLIVRARHTQGLTQTELAQKAGVSRAWLASVEGGKPRMDASLVLRTLAALNILLTADAGDLAPEKAKATKAKHRTPPVDIDSIVEAARKRARHG